MPFAETIEVTRQILADEIADTGAFQITYDGGIVTALKNSLEME